MAWPITSSPPSGVKVYYGKPMLPDVARVLACLHEKEVDFKLIDISPGRNNENIIRFQASRSPVSGFEDGDVKLFESRSICRHIVEKYAKQGTKHLLGRDLLERASIEQWLKTEEHSFDPPSWALVFHLAFRVPSPDRALLSDSQRALAKVLDVYEQRLAESRYLASDEFSLADLSHLPNSHYLVNSERWGPLFESRRNVWNWWTNISNRNSWHKVVDTLDQVGLFSGTSSSNAHLQDYYDSEDEVEENDPAAHTKFSVSKAQKMDTSPPSRKVVFKEPQGKSTSQHYDDDDGHVSDTETTPPTRRRGVKDPVKQIHTDKKSAPSTRGSRFWNKLTSPRQAFKKTDARTSGGTRSVPDSQNKKDDLISREEETPTRRYDTESPAKEAHFSTKPKTSPPPKYQDRKAHVYGGRDGPPHRTDDFISEDDEEELSDTEMTPTRRYDTKPPTKEVRFSTKPTTSPSKYHDIKKTTNEEKMRLKPTDARTGAEMRGEQWKQQQKPTSETNTKDSRPPKEAKNLSSPARTGLFKSRITDDTQKKQDMLPGGKSTAHVDNKKDVDTQPTQKNKRTYPKDSTGGYIEKKHDEWSSKDTTHVEQDQDDDYYYDQQAHVSTKFGVNKEQKEDITSTTETVVFKPPETNTLVSKYDDEKIVTAAMPGFPGDYPVYSEDEDDQTTPIPTPKQDVSAKTDTDTGISTRTTSPQQREKDTEAQPKRTEDIKNLEVRVDKLEQKDQSTARSIDDTMKSAQRYQRDTSGDFIAKKHGDWSSEAAAQREQDEAARKREESVVSDTMSKQGESKEDSPSNGKSSSDKSFSTDTKNKLDVASGNQNEDANKKTFNLEKNLGSRKSEANSPEVSLRNGKSTSGNISKQQEEEKEKKLYQENVADKSSGRITNKSVVPDTKENSQENVAGKFNGRTESPQSGQEVTRGASPNKVIGEATKDTSPSSNTKNTSSNQREEAKDKATAGTDARELNKVNQENPDSSNATSNKTKTATSNAESFREENKEKMKHESPIGKPKDREVAPNASYDNMNTASYNADSFREENNGKLKQENSAGKLGREIAPNASTDNTNAATNNAESFREENNRENKQENHAGKLNGREVTPDTTSNNTNTGTNDAESFKEENNEKSKQNTAGKRNGREVTPNTASNSAKSATNDANYFGKEDDGKTKQDNSAGKSNNQEARPNASSNKANTGEITPNAASNNANSATNTDSFEGENSGNVEQDNNTAGKSNTREVTPNASSNSVNAASKKGNSFGKEDDRKIKQENFAGKPNNPESAPNATSNNNVKSSGEENNGKTKQNYPAGSSNNPEFTPNATSDNAENNGGTQQKDPVGKSDNGEVSPNLTDNPNKQENPESAPNATSNNMNAASNKAKSSGEENNGKTKHNDPENNGDTKQKDPVGKFDNETKGYPSSNDTSNNTDFQSDE